ncbi:MAG: phasin family protein [Polynucleobacter sp.]
MANQKEFMEWQKDRAKELFALSHKLLETAKQFSEHQAAEIKVSMDYAKSYAKQAATNDVNKLKALQEQFAEEASARMVAYQKKVKALLKAMETEAADEAEKHLNKARNAMETWLKEASKNLPAGADKFTDVVRDIAAAGDKVMKEGRKMAKQAAEAAEQGMENLEKMVKQPSAKKSAPAAKKAPAKKAARKTTRRR